MTAVEPDVDDRTQRVTNIIDRHAYSCGTDGPLIAAVRVLADPELQHALTVRDRLRARHDLIVRDSVGWREVCSCGLRWDACEDAAIAWGHEVAG